MSLDLNPVKKQGIQDNFEYSGRVIANDDPERRGRVKARIQDLQNNMDDAHIPWAVPGAMGGTCGAGPETGYFSVPEVGTQVTIKYPDGDKYNPKWYPYGVTKDTIPEEALQDYPYTHLFFKAINRSILWFNRKKEMFKGIFVKDVDLEITNDVKIKVGNDLTITISGNKQVTIEGEGNVRCAGALNITCDSSATITASDIHLRGPVTIHGDGRCTGDWTVDGTIHGTHG